VRSLFNRSRKTNAQSLCSPRAFQLYCIASAISAGGKQCTLTPHVRLNVSRSTNSRDTVSSPRLDLYCFSNRVHVSVYSASVTTSLMYAFSSPSRVTMMLYISARDSYKSRSTELDASLTSWNNCKSIFLSMRRGIHTSSRLIEADRAGLGV
jgi:hypothetical protein